MNDCLVQLGQREIDSTHGSEQPYVIQNLTECWPTAWRTRQHASNEMNDGYKKKNLVGKKREGCFLPRVHDRLNFKSA